MTKMKIIFTALICSLAIGSTIYSGVLHGRIRHKFGLGQDLTDKVRLVENLPSKFGVLEDGRPAWVMLGKPQKLDDEVVDLLECSGYFQASYRSTLRPEWCVQLLVLVGPSGPLLVHTPEVCYPAVGNKYISGPDPLEIRLSEEKQAALKIMMFKRGNLRSRTIRVGYAFSDGDGWVAPENERNALAGSLFLYKVQLHAVLPYDSSITEDGDPLAEFARCFMQDFSG